MIGKKLVIGAAVLHLALASVASTRTVRAQDTGGGWQETVACATCIVVALGSAASGYGPTAMALTLMIGGPQAIALVGTITACVNACAEVIESIIDKLGEE